MASASTFVYVTFIRTTPQKLWQALTTPEFSRQYWFGVSTVSSWETGAPWALKFDDGRVPDSGIVTESDPPRRLELTWRHELVADEGYTRCVFDLVPEGDSVKLTITHTSELEQSRVIQHISNGWPKIISNLKSLLETGTVLFAERIQSCS
ncbi:SRPBCC family protein [Silvimonas sp. JCM 19000]